LTTHLPGFKNLAGVAAPNFLSKQFSNFFNGYTKAFNNKYDRNESLFLKPFKKKAISDREYLAACILYIHLNPVKHGFRKHPKDWEWSSYHSLHLERLNSIDSLFTNQKKYFQAHEEKIRYYDDYDKLESYFLD